MIILLILIICAVIWWRKTNRDMEIENLPPELQEDLAEAESKLR